MKLGIGRVLAAAGILSLVADRSREARAARAAALVLLALAGACCRSQPASSKPDDPALVLSPGDQKTACRQAAAKLAPASPENPGGLGCRESRPDFEQFCLNALDAGIPIRPLCLATMSSCSEVDTRCR